jgi:hypothetical protein
LEIVSLVSLQAALELLEEAESMYMIFGCEHHHTVVEIEPPCDIYARELA